MIAEISKVSAVGDKFGVEADWASSGRLFQAQNSLKHTLATSESGTCG